MRTWSMIVVALALVGVVGCGKSEDSACGTSDDCAEGQVCEDGVCQAPAQNTCSEDSDCPGGYVCLANKCERGDEPDMGSNNDNNSTPDMGDDEEDTGGPDMNFDNIPPEVVSVTPADETTDVALDSTVQIEFSEAMREATLNVQSVTVRNPANDTVMSEVSYDAATNTATIAPMAPLRPATPYRVVATVNVRDEAFNALSAEYETKFYTTYEEPSGLRELAETWAPHIYQAIGDTNGGGPNADIPTTVDFDRNLKARDNKSKSVLGSTKTTATVHYNVVESKSHYFIVYALYYPVRKTQSGTSEHDFTGAVFVIDKATEKLLVVDGLKVAEGSDTVLAFKPSDSAVDGPGVTQFESFDPAAMADGTHYPMFVPAGEHEACNWVVEGNPPVCLHNVNNGEGEFPQGPDNGVVLKPGDEGQEWDDAMVNQETGLKEMTYELVPLPSTLWVRRTDVGQEELWEQTEIYSPVGQEQPATTTGGSAIVLPNKLVSDDDPSFGKPPFQWLKTPTESNNGQWIIDPAFILPNRYDFENPWSNEYCYNIFLDINLRGDSGNPECGSDS